MVCAVPGLPGHDRTYRLPRGPARRDSVQKDLFLLFPDAAHRSGTDILLVGGFWALINSRL